MSPGVSGNLVHPGLLIPPKSYCAFTVFTLLKSSPNPGSFSGSLC
jgi:hypothetical protein